MSIKLQDIKEEFSKYFLIKDKWALDMVLATIIGNSVIPKDPIWTMLVAPSSGGKTTLIAPSVGVPIVFFLDDFTEKTLLSGYKVKGKEVSLLKQIGSGILAFSDFTNILAKNPNSRGEVLTQLKMVYDGKFTKYTGTGNSSWEGKMGFLGASTPDIYHQLEQGRSMGERFLYYWIEQPEDEEISLKQQENKLSSRQVTDIMQEMYGEYCIKVREYAGGPRGIPPLRLTDEQKLHIRQASKFCVNGKTTVHTNFKTGKVDQIPNKAGVGRDNKMFDALLHALVLMDAYEVEQWDLGISDDRIKLIEKCAYSSINRERRAILETLAKSDSAMTSSQIGASKGIGLEKEGVNTYLAPLHAVGLISKISGNPHKWQITDQDVLDFIERVSPNVKDITPTAKIEAEEDGDVDDWEKQAEEVNKKF